ncbi:hypothetical protein [Marinobacter sp.]|uniref:hypothetical protein n=1 Tax=Marinobacter sp. TaxID=50741 RepID=UPI003A942295
MPTYSVPCYECRNPTNVELPYFNLNEDQLEAVANGEKLTLTRDNLHPFPNSADGKQLPESWDDYDDHVPVCSDCGSDS